MRSWALIAFFLLTASCAASFAQNTASPPGGVIASTAWGTLWNCSSTFKVMRDTPPPSRKTGAVQISAAANEFEAFQLVLTPAKQVASVRVVPRKLIGPKNSALQAWSISVRNVEYVNVTEPTHEGLRAGAYPDPLPDFAAVAAPKGINTSIWVTVNVPPKTAAGLYSGAIDVIADGKKTAVPLKVRVWSFELPPVSKLRTAYGCDMGTVSAYQGATTLEQKRKLLDLYNINFWRHRVAPYSPYTYYELKPSLENGVIKVDFTEFDKAIQKYFPLFNSFMLPGFGMGDKLGLDMGDNYDQTKIEYMRMVTEHLVDKGQIGKGYNYITDEPTEEQYKQVKAASDLCRMADERIKVLLTEQVEPALADSVDIWVPLLSNYDESRAKAAQKAGDEVWWYVCCGPHQPYPNNFIDYPAIDQRILPWISWRHGVTGILYWSTTYWKENPYEAPMSHSPDGGKWGNGDGHLLYPATRKPSDNFVAKGPVDSIRWEMIRDGIEDYDYFRILKDRLGKGRTSGKSPAAIAKAEAALKMVDECGKSRTEYERNPAKLEAVRTKVAEAIEALK